MSPLFVFFIILAIVVPVFLCIIYKNKVDTLTTDNDKLKRRNETLEERFKNSTEEATQPAAEQTYQSGEELLKQFADSYQVQLEKQYDYENEAYELYQFMYQGGNFHCYAGKHSNEIILRYYYFKQVSADDISELDVLRLCDDVVNNRKFFKLIYSTDEDESGKYFVHWHLFAEMIELSQKGLEYLLKSTFIVAREASNAIDEICERNASEREKSVNDEKTITYREANSMRDTLQWMTDGKKDAN